MLSIATPITPEHWGGHQVGEGGSVTHAMINQNNYFAFYVGQTRESLLKVIHIHANLISEMAMYRNQI